MSVLLIAAILDYLLGDPINWPHPVKFMGNVISWYCQLVFKNLMKPLALRLAGIGLTIGLILGSGLAGWLIVSAVGGIHPGLGMIADIILLASCFAGRSLRNAAEAVLQPLLAGEIGEARQVLSRYVGRDTENLSAEEILRAVLETVAENATDGVMAPLFYAILGTAIAIPGNFPICVLPLAYKAASTLDSMVGYREPPYTDLGWCSARLEDYLTWLPCRLTVITLAFISGNPRQVWRICQRDAIKDPSPNSGWSEGAYAAILGVQLGGTNWYRGVAKTKPLLGDSLHAIALSDIKRSLQLTRACFLLWLLVTSVILIPNG
jgi:adenosylcobinamide-phosphate synthase